MTRILDLDGALEPQRGFLEAHGFPTQSLDALRWGPEIRLACSTRRFHAFERWLACQALPRADAPRITLFGSGDFHHVTLALLRQIREPFHLLVLDKHPDWMRSVPFLHCGTWLRHALTLPMLQRVFHCGGMADFDNGYRLLAPWKAIRNGRVIVFPVRPFVKGWRRAAQYPLFDGPIPLAERLDALLEPFRGELRRFPLYISVDKDVLRADDSAVNWDSGELSRDDACTLVRAFRERSNGRLVGADLLGDWSPIRLGRWLNRVNDWLDHPSPDHDPAEAATRNGRANVVLLQSLTQP